MIMETAESVREFDPVAFKASINNFAIHLPNENYRRGFSAKISSRKSKKFLNAVSASVIIHIIHT